MKIFVSQEVFEGMVIAVGLLTFSMVYEYNVRQEYRKLIGDVLALKIPLPFKRWVYDPYMDCERFRRPELLLYWATKDCADGKPHRHILKAALI